MSEHSILALFPGQGSQSVGMGQDLFKEHEFARELFAIADRALKLDLSQICFEGPESRLMETAVTQPAILTVSTICFELFRKSHDGAINTVVAAAGHSLGEYTALVAAGALSFEDAVQLVHKRGTYMQESVPAGEGKMVAVLGKEVAELEDAIEKTAGIAEIANINSPGQIVVAGSQPGVDEFLSHLGEAKAKELAVSAPFHCSLMQPAADSLAGDLKSLTIEEAQFPVYANYSASPIKAAEEIRESLLLQVCGRVRWVECMENAIQDTGPSEGYEFGGGRVLAGLLRRIQKGFPVRAVLSAGDLERE